MPGTLGTVKAMVRSLVDDPQGSYCTDDMLNPLIQDEYEACANELSSTGGTFEDVEQEIINLQPGTADLSVLQQSGGALEQMVSPETLWWKYTGTTADNYRMLRGPLEELPFRVPDNYMHGWQWIGSIVRLSQCVVAIDIKIRGEFKAPILRDDSSPILLHARLPQVLARRVAVLIGKIRGNDKWVQQYGADVIEGMDLIMTQITKSGQGTVLRIGKMSSRRGGNRGNFFYS